MRTIKLDKDFKKYLQSDIKALLNLLSNDDELGYNTLAGVISSLRTTASSLNLKADKLQLERKSLEKLPM